MEKKRNWMYIAIGSVVLSVISLFFPVISYTSSRSGEMTHYNILGLLNNSEMIENVFKEYSGSFLHGVSYSAVGAWVVILGLVGAGAIVLAFIGITSMTKQVESETPFRLAICGLVGTAIPSLVLLILYLYSKNQYTGTMRLGAYIVVTPIAMVLACLAVTSRHRLTKEERQLQKEAAMFIRPAGDLPEAEIGGNRGNGW